MRVFLDANVLFSGARSASMVERALRELSEGGARLLTCQHAATEACRNLAAKRAIDLPNLEAWLEKMEVTALMADASHLPLADKDRPVFGGAMAVGCTHFVTGDMRHFGDWMGKTVEGIKVRTLAALLAELDEDRRRS